VRLVETVAAEEGNKVEDLAGFAFTPFVLMLTLLSRWAGGLVDLTGPRLPLIVGPVVAGCGFLLMALPGLTQGPSQYWTTFFPGVVVLGIGMGITVAPLTTAVMNSVATHLSGTASGINNAVARTAGVLAIAVTGALALFLFANALQTHTAAIPLPDAAQSALVAQAARLAAATVPPQVPEGNVQAVATAIKIAFVYTFRLIMLLCTGLSWLGAILAGLLVQ
jgi:MFS family permease